MSTGPSISWATLYKLPDGHLKSWSVLSQSSFSGKTTKHLLEIWIDLKKPPHDLLQNKQLGGIPNFKLKVFYSDHTEVFAEMDLHHLPDGTLKWISDVPIKHFKGVKKHFKTKLVSWAARRNYHKKRLIATYYKVKNLSGAPYNDFLTPDEIIELEGIAAKLQTFIDGYRNDYRTAKNIHIV